MTNGRSALDNEGSDPEKDRIRRVTGLLYEVSRSIRVLGPIKWSTEVKTAFFAQGARELPRVSYTAVDPTPALEAVREARGYRGADTGRTPRCDDLGAATETRITPGIPPSALRASLRLFQIAPGDLVGIDIPQGTLS